MAAMTLGFITPQDLATEYCVHELVQLHWSSKTIHMSRINKSIVALEIALYYLPGAMGTWAVEVHKVICDSCSEVVWSAT